MRKEKQNDDGLRTEEEKRHRECMYERQLAKIELRDDYMLLFAFFGIPFSLFASF